MWNQGEICKLTMRDNKECMHALYRKKCDYSSGEGGEGATGQWEVLIKRRDRQSLTSCHNCVGRKWNNPSIAGCPKRLK